MTELILTRLEIDLAMAKARVKLARNDESRVKWYKIHAAIEKCIHEVRAAC